jgi:proteasome lid subunit RPN8/RPN11
VANLDLVTAATYALRHEAEIARARLNAAGIDALVQADDEGGLNPGFFAEYGVRLVVRREDLVAAVELLGPDDIGSVIVTREHLDAVMAHAAFCAPEEACGLLAFSAPGRVSFVYALTNVDHSPYRFTVGPDEHFHAIRHAERNGWEIGGSFHSHPGGTPRPSGTDVAEASAADWVHLLAGQGRGEAMVVRAYRIRDGSPEELAVVVAGSSVP